MKIAVFLESDQHFWNAQHSDSSFLKTNFACCMSHLFFIQENDDFDICFYWCWNVERNQTNER